MALRIASMLVVALALAGALLWFVPASPQDGDSVLIGTGIEEREDEAVDADTKSGRPELPPIQTEAFVSETGVELPQLPVQAVDPEGRPLPHLSLELELHDSEHLGGSWFWGQEPPPDPRIRGLARSRVTTDAEGRFALPDQGRARFHLVAHGEERSGSVNLARDEEAARLVLHRFAKIVVTVLDADGRPLPHIEVEAQRDRRGGTRSGLGVHDKTRAWTRDPSGEAHLRLAAPEDGEEGAGFTVHALTADTAAFFTDGESPRFAESGVTRLTLKGRRGVDLEVQITEGGAPVGEGWRLLGFGRDPNAFESFIESRSRLFRGSKVTIGSLPPGQLTQLQLAETGYPPVWRTVRLPRESGHHRVEIERPPAGATLALRITDAEGTPIGNQGFSFAWRPAGAMDASTHKLPLELYRHCATDAEGRGEILVPSGFDGELLLPQAPAYLPPGVVPSRPRPLPLPALAAGSTTPLEVKLPTATTLVAGRIRAEDPALLERLVLKLAPLNWDEAKSWKRVAEIHPGSDGRFRFASIEAVPPNFEMELSARGNLGGSISRRVRVGEEDLVLDVTPLGRLEVRFRGDLDSLPVVRVGVWPSRSDPAALPWPREQQWQNLSKERHAVFTFLPQGLYDVHVMVNKQEILRVPRVRVDHRQPSTDARLLDRDLSELIGVTRLRIRDEAGEALREVAVRIASPRAPTSYTLLRSNAAGIATVAHAAGQCPPATVYSETHRSVSLQPTRPRHELTLRPRASLALAITAPARLPTNKVYDRWSVHLEPLGDHAYPIRHTLHQVLDLASGTARFPHVEDGRYQVTLQPVSSKTLKDDQRFTIFRDAAAAHRLGEVVIIATDDEKQVSYTVSSNHLRDLLRGSF